MTDAEILALADKCGAGWPDDTECEMTLGQLLAFARACETVERERVLDICQRFYSIEYIAQEIAAEIRGPSAPSASPDI
jgi:hypothetical protein